MTEASEVSLLDRVLRIELERAAPIAFGVRLVRAAQRDVTQLEVDFGAERVVRRDRALVGGDGVVIPPDAIVQVADVLV